MVDMGGLRGALVGKPGGAGLSVEQRKRLTIAVELVVITLSLSAPAHAHLDAKQCWPQCNPRRCVTLAPPPLLPSCRLHPPFCLWTNLRLVSGMGH
jgi:hypothetical protein